MKNPFIPNFGQVPLVVAGRNTLSGEIAKRIHQSDSYASQYRRRLLERGIIGTRGRGKVAFELPMLREYLPEYLEGRL